MAPRPGQMTNEHKAALAEGRAEGRAVRAYLEAIEANKPRRGRKRTPESMKTRIAKIDASIGDADAISRLHMVQDRLDLVAAIEAAEATFDIAALEDGFIAAAGSYGERKRISYAAWREVGVSADVLKRAGISRS